MSNTSCANSSISYTETCDFMKLKDTASFVDKTLMIKEVIAGPEYMMITSPRKFGKSTNLNMLRRFFDVAEDNRSTFSDLKIGKEYPDHVEKHCGKYVVLWTDLSWFAIRIDSYDNAMSAFRDILNTTYQNYADILTTSTKLNESERQVCLIWSHPLNYKNMDHSDIGAGIKNIVDYLYKHYEKKVVILVDEFDSVCSQAMHLVEEKILNQIITFYFKMFAFVVKTDYNPKSFRAVFTGIAAVTCSGHSPLNNVVSFNFMENGRFVKYYGILVEEFEELLKKSEFQKFRGQKEKAKEYYNGYQFERHHVLSTYSIVKYLHPKFQDEKLWLRNYWSNSGAIEGFSNVWSRKEFQPLLKNIISKVQFPVKRIEKLKPQQLKELAEIFSRKKKSVLPVIDEFMTYLQQLGYLAIVERDETNNVMCIPNEEIVCEFREIMLQCFMKKYSIAKSDLQSCAKLFNSLEDLVNEKSIEEGCTIDELLQAIARKLEKCTKKCLLKDFINEASFEHLVFAVLIHSKFKPISQKRVIEKKNSKRLDLAFYGEKCGFVIELKVQEKDSAATALNQIKRKKYYNVFLDRGLKNVENCLCIGMHLDKASTNITIERIFVILRPVLKDQCQVTSG